MGVVHAVVGKVPCATTALAQPSAESIDFARSGPRALTYALNENPSWLPGILAQLEKTRGSGHRLEQYVLFRRNGTPSFLALIWETESGRKFELHQVGVESPDRVTLTFRRRYEDRFLSIVEPTGHDINHDGVPVLFLLYWSGGSGSSHGIRIYRLDRASIDITPIALVYNFSDLDGDGRPELFAYDTHW